MKCYEPQVITLPDESHLVLRYMLDQSALQKVKALGKEYTSYFTKGSRNKSYKSERKLIKVEKRISACIYELLCLAATPSTRHLVASVPALEQKYIAKLYLDQMLENLS